MRIAYTICRFIFEVGKTMNLYHLTMATAAVYFHRFYMFHAFQDFSRYVGGKNGHLSEFYFILLNFLDF